MSQMSSTTSTSASPISSSPVHSTKSRSKSLTTTSPKNTVDSTKPSKQTKRKVRSNPSSPQTSRPSTPTKQTSPNSPVKSPEIFVDSEPRPTTTPKISKQQKQSQISLLGSPKNVNSSTSTIPIKIVPVAQASSSSTVRSTPTRHQYAGPAFTNSPTPDSLPQPSFLMQEDCSKTTSPTDSSELRETEAVPTKLVFDDVQPSPSLAPQASAHVLLPSLPSSTFPPVMPYFVMVDHRLSQPSVAPYPVGYVQQPAHHFQPGSVFNQHTLSQGHTQVAFADPSAHLKRMLNISVA